MTTSPSEPVDNDQSSDPEHDDQDSEPTTNAPAEGDPTDPTDSRTDD